MHKGPVLAQRKVTRNSVTTEARVIDCNNCGFAHLENIPTEKELGEFYAFHFYDKEKPDYLVKMENEFEYWDKLYSWRTLQIKKHLGNKSDLKILDVGSSGGFFLNAAKNNGFKVFGIEPSTQASEYSSQKFGIPVETKSYEDCQFEEASFDAIHCSLVLEHLISPQKYVEWCKKYLKPGGLLCIEAPNEFNDYQTLLTKDRGYDAWFVAPPDHINYFTPDSLSRLAEKNGFKTDFLVTTFPIEMMALMGMDYLKEPSLGREAHQSRMNFELSLLKSSDPDRLLKFYEASYRAKIGRQILAFYKKV